MQNLRLKTRKGIFLEREAQMLDSQHKRRFPSGMPFFLLVNFYEQKLMTLQ